LEQRTRWAKGPESHQYLVGQAVDFGIAEARPAVQRQDVR